jgi:hypothetical protein
MGNKTKKTKPMKNRQYKKLFRRKIKVLISRYRTNQHVSIGTQCPLCIATYKRHEEKKCSDCINGQFKSNIFPGNVPCQNRIIPIVSPQRVENEGKEVLEMVLEFWKRVYFRTIFIPGFLWKDIGESKWFRWVVKLDRKLAKKYEYERNDLVAYMKKEGMI